MQLLNDSDQLTNIEDMLLSEREMNGRIMVRSIDKIHAATGIGYAAISEVARRLEEREV
jgi:hypothetical protein